MKRFFIVLLLVFLVISGQVYAQMAVIDAAVNTMLGSMQIQQVIYYVQSLEQMVEQALHLKNQVEIALEMSKRAMQNLQSAEINSYDDFFNWYNRQLYLEHQTMEIIENWNVYIGKKNYSVWDFEGMADGLNDTYIKFWNKEFTEDQNKAMWINMGLTPANYAYRQSFTGKLRALHREFLAAPDIQNEEYMKNMERNNEILNELANDINLETDDKIGEKQVAMLQAETLVSINKVLADIAMNQAREMQRKSLESYLEKTPVDEPVLSIWPENVWSIERF